MVVWFLLQINLPIDKELANQALVSYFNIYAAQELINKVRSSEESHYAYSDINIKRKAQMDYLIYK